MMGTLLGNLLQAALTPSPPQIDTAYQQQLLMQQKAAAAKKKEAQRKQDLLIWQKRQDDDAVQREAEQKRKETEGADLFARMDPVGSHGSLSMDGMESTTEGGLEAFNWDRPEIAENELQPLGTGRYDTSALSLWQRLLCATHFSELALAAAKRGDDVNTRYLNEQAEKVMSGQMTDLECRFPGPPDVPTLAKFQPQELQGEMAFFENMLKSVQQDARKLQEIEKNLQHTDKKIRQAEEKKGQAEQIIADVRGRAAAGEKPDEKQKDDDLLAQAQALLQEAEAELKETNHAKQTLLGQKEEIRDQLKEMQGKINPKTGVQ
jgi:hypothetical protein